MPARMGGMQACCTAVGWRMLIAAIAFTRNGATPNSAQGFASTGAGGSTSSAGAAEAGSEPATSSSDGRAEVLATGENSRGGNSSEADMVMRARGW